MPFEYICGCMGIGRSALLINVTSGGSETLSETDLCRQDSDSLVE